MQSNSLDQLRADYEDLTKSVDSYRNTLNQYLGAQEYLRVLIAKVESEAESDGETPESEPLSAKD